MKGLFVALGAVAVGTVPAPQAPPPVVHHVNPDWTTSRISFGCADGKRQVEFTRNYRGDSRFTFADRKGQKVRGADLNQASAALEKILFWSIVPQCTVETDLLLLSGVMGEKKVMAILLWSEDAFRVTQVDILG